MTPSLPPRERQVLEMLLNKGELTVAEVCHAFEGRISASAIRTMLVRLMGKRVVDRKQDERGLVYFAVVDPYSMGIAQLKSMANTFFEGSYLSAASALLGAAKGLDRKTLDEIERMIEAAKHKETQQ